MFVLGLCGKVLVARPAAGVASVRRHQKLPPCETEPVPVGSRMDLLLPKAEPISDPGHAFATTYLRKG